MYIILIAIPHKASPAKVSASQSKCILFKSQRGWLMCPLVFHLWRTASLPLFTEKRKEKRVLLPCVGTAVMVDCFLHGVIVIRVLAWLPCWTVVL